MSAALLAPARTHRTRDLATGLFFGTWLLYLLTANYLFQSIDTTSMYYPSWQLARHGNITMTAFADDLGFWVDTGDRLVSNRFPGATWLATPFYLLDPFGSPLPLMANLTAAAAVAGAVTVLFVLLCRLVPTGTALTASLVFAFATPTWTVSADALWTHGPGQLWLLSGVLLFSRGRYLAAGLLLGAAVVTRPHYALVPAVLGLFELARTRRLRPVTLIALGSGLGLLVLLVYNQHVFGSWDPRGGYAPAPGDNTGRSLDPTGITALQYGERLLGTLVSPSRGVLVLTPFLLLLPGLRAAWRTGPSWVRAAAVGGTAYLLVQLRGNGWTGGYSFYSYRLAIEWLTLCAPLLVLAYVSWTSRARWRRRAFLALVLFSLATHAVGALLYRGDGAEPDYWRHWPPGQLISERPLASLVVASIAVVLGLLIVRVAGRRTPERLDTVTSTRGTAPRG